MASTRRTPSPDSWRSAGAGDTVAAVWPRHPLLRYVLRRFGASAIAIVGVVTAVFLALRLAPGDPVETILGEQASDADKAAFRERMGLADSLPSQYARLWGQVLDGSLGASLESAERPITVSSVIARSFPATFELAVGGMLIAVLIAFPLGIASAVRQYSLVDNVSMLAALVGVALPNFWLGPMLIWLFCVSWGWFPDPGAAITGLESLVLPSVVLGAALAAKLTRMVRSSVLEALAMPFTITARAKGLDERQVMVGHVLRNALIPVVTVMSLQFAALLTGTIITEKVFARPGLGTLLLDAIARRNYPVVQGCVIVIALTYVVVNLATDLLYAAIDPRVRLQGPEAT